MKTLNKLGTERNSNMKKAYSQHEKPTANVTLNGESLKAFLLKLVTRQGCRHFLLLFFGCTVQLAGS